MSSDTRATSPLRKRLGRGLGSLISSPVQVEGPSAPRQTSTPAAAAPANAPLSIPRSEDVGVRLIDLAQIKPNPNQPRQTFDETSLSALANSIAASGLMQPIVVRPSRSGAAEFQIIAGERRWRAAQRVGLTQIPARICDVDDRTAAELSLIENLQREDLNPIERAEAFRRLMQDHGLTHQDIAQQVGLERSTISNHLRLLDLDDFTRDAVRKAQISLGHAKVLLGVTNIARRAELAQQLIREDWSVRELERRVKQPLERADGAPRHEAPRTLSPAAANAGDLARRLGEHLGTKVSLHPGRTKGSGKLVIEFFSLDQFEGLMRRMQFESD